MPLFMDIHTVDSDTFSVSSQLSTPRVVEITDDGTKVYVWGDVGAQIGINRYDCTVAVFCSVNTRSACVPLKYASAAIFVR